MKKVDDVTYNVIPNEKITIKVTPTNLGGSLPSVVAAFDGKDLPNTGTNSAPKYMFNVTKPPGRTHRVMMECTFQFDSPDNAFYKVAISGKKDEGCPCDFTIAKVDELKAVGIRFKVKAAN